MNKETRRFLKDLNIAIGHFMFGLAIFLIIIGYFCAIVGIYELSLKLLVAGGESFLYAVASDIIFKGGIL